MNYLEWSQEYIDTAEKLKNVITLLKKKRKKSPLAEKKEIDAKLSMYRACYGECVQTAALLRQRHKEAA